MQGYSFLTGCAHGVDESFRTALADSDYSYYTLASSAFKSKVAEFRGILPLYVVPQGLPPKAALAQRTLWAGRGVPLLAHAAWMVRRCSLLILFPSSPMGRGSQLAFNTAIMNSKPVFVVSDERPQDSLLYSVFPSDLFGIVQGYWCIPPIYKPDLTFDELQ